MGGRGIQDPERSRHRRHGHRLSGAQIALDRLVALKTIPPWVKITPYCAGPLRRRGQGRSRLRHPNIVQIHDIGTLKGRPYLSLEYAQMGNLSRAIANRLPEPREAATIAEVLARACSMPTIGGFCIVTSSRLIFLCAVRQATALASSTQSSSRSPTLVWRGFWAVPRLSPCRVPCLALRATWHTSRQGHNDLVGPATDVYGLGIVLYEMLCGQPPFQGESEWAIIHQVVTAAVPPIRNTRPECPKALEAICMKCLNKSPSDRYLSAALADDLNRFLDGEQTTDDVNGRCTRRKLLAAGAVGAAGVAAGTLWMSGRRPPFVVGIVQSQSGVMGDGGHAAILANLVAIHELNAAGGVLGRMIAPIVADGESDEDVFAREARRLISLRGAKVIFAGVISSLPRNQAGGAGSQSLFVLSG